MKKIIIFGAGKIGRSFIGQLFSLGGYQVVFIDISEETINALNEKREYKVVIKYEKEDETLKIKNVRGLHFSETGKIHHEISNCDLVALCAGQSGLPAIIKLLGSGIMERYKIFPEKPLDIIIAENLRNAASVISHDLKKVLPAGFPISSYLGLVETSIGKMVPIMPDEAIKQDKLLVYAEPYNTLILDKKAFKSVLPDVPGLQFKENMKAWVDRKLFIHNFGHACSAYAGFHYNPCYTYLYEVMENKQVRVFVNKAMVQSAHILMALYPGEFTLSGLQEHIDDLMARFGNKALGDTVYRVGCDLYRKLSYDDRLLAPFHAGIKNKLNVDMVIKGICFAFFFRAKDSQGKYFPEDEKFIRELEGDGPEKILKTLCRTNEKETAMIIQKMSKVNNLSSY